MTTQLLVSGPVVLGDVCVRRHGREECVLVIPRDGFDELDGLWTALAVFTVSEQHSTGQSVSLNSDSNARITT